jgi:hypothetical protein
MPEPIKIGEAVSGKYHCEAVVLSGAVLHNKKLGEFLIDLPSLLYHKERVTVDYNHESDVILGYAENFRITDSGLAADVYLIESISKVSEIVTLIKGGTPFEISPSINEEEGIHENDNGLNIYRNVPLRGVAVCPFGTDRFTTLTLLKENSMSKDTKTTNLAADGNADGESAAAKVKDPDLAEFTEVYGTEKGLELWQSGADIADIRKLKELIEKYGVPGKPEGTPPPQTTELNQDGSSSPENKTSPEKTDEKTELKAVITALKTEIAGLKVDVTKLHAAVPRGESEPAHHNYNSGQEKTDKKLSDKEQYLQSFQKRFNK